MMGPAGKNVVIPVMILKISSVPRGEYTMVKELSFVVEKLLMHHCSHAARE